tara:strand:- start:664 stop:786 length:123 start_codon:yes stop_codon:yes gene_type:complete
LFISKDATEFIQLKKKTNKNLNFTIKKGLKALLVTSLLIK